MRFQVREKNRSTLKQAMRILHTIISHSKDRLMVLVCGWPVAVGKHVAMPSRTDPYVHANAYGS